MASVPDPTEPTAEQVAAAKQVAKRDPALRAFIAKAGPVRMRGGVGDYFGSLVRSIMYQQLAGRAAAAIHGRFVEALGGKVTPDAVLAADPEKLRAAGLSAAKLAAVLDLAQKSTDGTVPLHDLQELPDDELVARLSSVRGIGRWTAQMFLLFELRRLDVWPVDDLGVRNGYRLIHGLPEMPKPKELEALGDVYRPYRSIAAWYCWQAVHLMRGDMLLPGGEPAAAPKGRAARRSSARPGRAAKPRA
ncbi:MAG TPA: DNA-3-methyladenine glycosylase 2 family protein [Candidatus Dormibacteraeota bacterium]|jgi:DNA-3-methyladenine glycosylase II|nr:DNA-3-methyladenine glycosylase 2 family protein [Candidatus Dormibacteraeota bacterium]